MTELKGQKCAICGKNQVTLREEELDIPHFGKVFILTLECAGCGYKKSDIEPAEAKEPCKYTLDVSTEADMSIKIIKSSEGSIKIPNIITIESGPASDGYITNVEGLLQRVRQAIESAIDEEEENSEKKAKAMLKKLTNVELGRDSIKIIIEDPSGHSAILSEKAVRSKL